MPNAMGGPTDPAKYVAQQAHAGRIAVFAWLFSLASERAQRSEATGLFVRVDVSGWDELLLTRKCAPGIGCVRAMVTPTDLTMIFVGTVMQPRTIHWVPAASDDSEITGAKAVEWVDMAFDALSGVA